MNLWRFILRHLRYRLVRHLLLALATAICAATLSGSLLIGAAVRHALQAVALERIGSISVAADSQASPCRASLAAALQRELAGAEPSVAVAAMLSLRGAAQSKGGQQSAARIYAVKPEEFRAFFADSSSQQQAEAALGLVAGRRAVANEILGRALGLQAGDHVVVSLPARGYAPIRTIFGKRRQTDAVRNARLEIAAIIPAVGVGRFSLEAEIAPQPLLFADREWLAEQAGWNGLANVLLVGAKGGQGNESAVNARLVKMALNAMVAPEDVGLKLHVASDSATLALLPGRAFAHDQTLVARARRWRFPPEEVCAYLANDIALANGSSASVPYSIIMGMTEKTLAAECGIALATEEAAVNRWLAAELGCRVGDRIRISYYRHGPGGDLQTSACEARVAAIISEEMCGRMAAWMPDYPGLTDAATMAEWQPPFPIDLKRIRQQDEDFWNRWRAAPKVILPLAAVQAMWMSASAADAAVASAPAIALLWHAHGRAEDAAELSRRAARSLLPACREVRQEALASAEGAVDFGVLFLGLGSFLALASMVVLWLLFTLMVEERAAWIGLLLALGFRRRMVMALLLLEGLAGALMGSALGTLAGYGYAAALMWAMPGIWQDALGEYLSPWHADAHALGAGLAVSMIAAVFAMAWSLRRCQRSDIQHLLNAQMAEAPSSRQARPRQWLALWIGSGALAALIGWHLPAVGKATLCGLWLLVGFGAALAMLWMRCSHAASVHFWSLVWQQTARHQRRSLTVVAILACVSFMLAAVAANPAADALDAGKFSATGGFAYVVRTAMPVLADLTSEKGWRETGAAEAYAAVGRRLRLYPLAEISGDDAGCQALAKPLLPHYIGVSRAFIARGGFSFAALANARQDNPWSGLLQYDERTLPVFLDDNSSRWLWRRSLGDSLPFAAPMPQARIIGLMRPHIFAGKAIAAEEALRQTGKAEEGYRLFAVEKDRSLPDEEARRALASALAAYGAEIRPAAELVVEQRRIEDTYRAAFGLLAACGLLFGLAGMSAMVIRNAWERRGEMAMLMAVGWQKKRIALLLAAENAGLTIIGMAIGLISMIAALPWFGLAQPLAAWQDLFTILAAAAALSVLCSWLAAKAALAGDIVAALRAE